MNTELLIDTIDTHTAGEPTRIVTSGIDPYVNQSGTVREKRDRFAKAHDDIRRRLMMEPRGHDSMFGAVPTSPSDPAADLGVFFMDNGGYLDMCGHGTMGMVKAFVETGAMAADSEIVVETPAGLVSTWPQFDEEDTVEAVTIENVASFVHDDLEVAVEHRGVERTVPVTVIYAGNYFSLVDVEAVDFAVERRYVPDLVDLGLSIQAAVNGEIAPEDPFTDESTNVQLTEFYERCEPVDRNLTVFGNGLVDRSPCGTGTCAKMALLYQRGELSEDEDYPHESVIGTRFTGRIVETGHREGRDLVTPEITGSAYITGKHTFLKEPADPLEGFKLTEE